MGQNAMLRGVGGSLAQVTQAGVPGSVRNRGARGVRDDRTGRADIGGEHVPGELSARCQ
jgi:hypothetical protein